MAKINDITEAMELALHAHEGKVRKLSPIPQILHPMEAATIAATLTQDLEVIQAALLHDTIEDTNLGEEEIEATCGARVLRLVLSETEPKIEGQSKSESWITRKQNSLKLLEHASDPGTPILWLSDKLSNMRSIYRTWKQEGDAVFGHFHMKDKATQAWYYRTILHLLSPLKDTYAYEEYKRLVEEIFQNIQEGDTSL